MKNLTSTLTSTLKISALAGACIAFSACGAIAEKITEEGAERIIEAESGEDVDIDFDSGDGSFSIETEEGSFAVDDDGNFVVTDQDGSVFTGSASDDGLIVTDADGDPVLNVNGDEGEILVQGDDGDSVFRVVTDIPDEWPSAIPRPDGLQVEGGSYVAENGEVLMTVVGTPSGSAVDYTDSYLGSVASSGFTETGRFDQSADGSATAQRSYENNFWVININGYDSGDDHVVNISVMSKG